MLFGYPIDSTSMNWLHDCLAAMVTAIHTALDAGAPPLEWPACIPEEHRERLTSRLGLRDRLAVYRGVAERLTLVERAQVLRCLSEQNSVSDLVHGDSECERLTDLPEDIRDPVDKLFTFAFGLLTDLGVRDEHYQAIYEQVPSAVCPFCGCEYFDAPADTRGEAEEEARRIREDLDHYLPRSRYPFAAANLRNLSPMGSKCNGYKRDQDILRNADGVRRRAFYPYVVREVSISLTNSIPFAGADGRKPEWRIEFHPDSPECTTWDVVFSLRTRLRTDVLDPLFDRWLQEFARWLRGEYPQVEIDDDMIIAGLDRYAENEAIKGLNGRDFLRAPVIRMLHRHCAAENDRLLALVKSVLVHAIPPPRTVN
jgi:hypothetical protein